MDESPGRELAARLEQKASVLSQRCTVAMYADPFWQARFGDRGRKHAEADSAYHVKYVAAALREGDMGVFKNYALWLRGVLAARGMCSFHLAESFRQLTLAMQAEAVDDAQLAAEVLAEGVRALEYTDGAAGELDANREALRDGVAASLGSASYRADELLSFLADALARVDAESFKAHVRFLERSLTTGEQERQALHATIAAIRAAAVPRLSVESAARLVALAEAAAPEPAA